MNSRAQVGSTSSFNEELQLATSCSKQWDENGNLPTNDNHQCDQCSIDCYRFAAGNVTISQLSQIVCRPTTDNLLFTCNQHQKRRLIAALEYFHNRGGMIRVTSLDRNCCHAVRMARSTAHMRYFEDARSHSDLESISFKLISI